MDLDSGEDKAGSQPTEAERPTPNDIEIDDQIFNIKSASSNQNQPTTEANKAMFHRIFDFITIHWLRVFNSMIELFSIVKINRD